MMELKKQSIFKIKIKQDFARLYSYLEKNQTKSFLMKYFVECEISIN